MRSNTADYEALYPVLLVVEYYIVADRLLSLEPLYAGILVSLVIEHCLVLQRSDFATSVEETWLSFLS